MGTSASRPTKNASTIQQYSKRVGGESLGRQIDVDEEEVVGERGGEDNSHTFFDISSEPVVLSVNLNKNLQKRTKANTPHSIIVNKAGQQQAQPHHLVEAFDDEVQ